MQLSAQQGFLTNTNHCEKIRTNIGLLPVIYTVSVVSHSHLELPLLCVQINSILMPDINISEVKYFNIQNKPFLLILMKVSFYYQNTELQEISILILNNSLTRENFHSYSIYVVPK